MIFQHTWQQVLDGTKTQTRRLMKPHYVLCGYANGGGYYALETEHGRRLYTVGNTYAVSPGRGKQAVGRICLLAIWKERLQDITREGAIAEGCKDWTYRNWDEDILAQSATGHFAGLWTTINTRKGTRWIDNPLVLVFSFEVVS